MLTHVNLNKGEDEAAAAGSHLATRRRAQGAGNQPRAGGEASHAESNAEEWHHSSPLANLALKIELSLRLPVT